MALTVAVLPAGALPGEGSLYPSNPRCSYQGLAPGASCTEWVTRYDDGDQTTDRAIEGEQGPGGDAIYALAWENTEDFGPDDANILLLKLDAETGTQEWSASWSAPTGGYAHAFDMEPGPDGQRVYVTGVYEGAEGDWAPITLAYEAQTGQLLWSQTEVNPPTLGLALEVSPDGSQVVVAGNTATDDSDDPARVLAYEAPTGHELWTRTVTVSDSLSLQERGLAYGPSGDQVYLLGIKNKAIALDTGDGSAVWNFSGGLTRQIDMAVTPDGDTIVVAGLEIVSRDEGGTYALDTSSGELLWRETLSPPSGLVNFTGFEAIDLSSDGSTAYVAGKTYPSLTQPSLPRRPSGLVAAYETGTGTKSWSQTYDTNSGAEFRDVAVLSQEGTVVAGGFSLGSGTGADGLHVGFDTSSGALEWSAQYHGGYGTDRTVYREGGVMPDSSEDGLWSVLGSEGPPPADNPLHENTDVGALRYDLADLRDPTPNLSD